MDGGLQRAELRLNPSDLGPIQIQLSITAQTADISFHAAHSQTREGIEQALPALRDMLAAQGLSLGQAGVSSGQDQRQGSDAANAQASARAGSAGRGGPVAGSSAGVAPVQMRALRGMLDMYA
jgi:flagellar hook-length control protein FliK